MSTSNLPASGLAQLRDIHLPDPLSLWPAPGWFLLAALLIGTLFGLGFLLYRHFKKQVPKWQALKKLSELELRYQQTQEASSIIAELSILLRRLALVYFPRTETAGLCGNEWLTFLDKTGNTRAFTAKLTQALTQAPYQKDPTQELTEALKICRHWIKAIGENKKLAS